LLVIETVLNSVFSMFCSYNNSSVALQTIVTTDLKLVFIDVI